MGAKVRVYGGKSIFERNLKHDKLKRSELYRLLDQKKMAKEKLVKLLKGIDQKNAIS